MDNPFENETSGQADWDSALSANFQAIDRGYHMSERAGIAINTGQALTLDSSGFFHVADGSKNPAAYAYTGASSGDSMTALGWGIVRSLSVNSALVCGLPLYVNTTGYLVNSGVLPVGVALSAGGVLFNPPRVKASNSTKFVSSLAVSAVVGSLHQFNLSLAEFGWNRRVKSSGGGLSVSCDIKFYADAALTDLQYQTFSGGINPQSLNDRAGWPFDTNSGTIYGTLAVFDANDTITLNTEWEF
jgi:hypothetical protein